MFRFELKNVLTTVQSFMICHNDVIPNLIGNPEIGRANTLFLLSTFGLVNNFLDSRFHGKDNKGLGKTIKGWE